MRLHVRVRGRVQGVGFRYFAHQAARELELSGWVRNCPDGNVELEAQGEPQRLEQFLTRLETGHPWARVERLTRQEIPERSDERGFTITL